MYISQRRSQRGFTIVELLIVIVVIGILAAVTVVAFNGVQSRAKNASIISGVGHYLKAIEMYRAEHGEYPLASAKNLDKDGVDLGSYDNRQFCLASDQSIANQLRTCGSHLWGAAPSQVVIASTVDPGNAFRFNDLVSPYLGGKMIDTYSERPMAPKQYEGSSIYGAVYSAGGSLNYPNTKLTYMLYGDTTCPSPSSGKIGYQNYVSNFKITTCVIDLGKPGV